MKKVLTIIICAASFAVNAQQFRIGASITPSIGFWDIEGDLYESSGTKFGVQAGLIVDQTLGSSERFALTSGLSWNLNPGGFQTANANGNTAFKAWNFNVMSIDLPITVRLRSDQLNKTVLFVQYGANFGFTLLKKVSLDGGQSGGGGFDYESVNPSLAMGAGIEYSISDEKALMINLYFLNGLKNMVIDNANDDNMFPQQLGLRVGMFF